MGDFSANLKHQEVFFCRKGGPFSGLEQWKDVMGHVPSEGREVAAGSGKDRLERAIHLQGNSKTWNWVSLPPKEPCPTAGTRLNFSPHWQLLENRAAQLQEVAVARSRERMEGQVGELNQGSSRDPSNYCCQGSLPKQPGTSFFLIDKKSVNRKEKTTYDPKR